LAFWIEHALDVSIERSQHADPREHARSGSVTVLNLLLTGSCFGPVDRLSLSVTGSPP
jgi:hypothetical protein